MWGKVLGRSLAAHLAQHDSFCPPSCNDAGLGGLTPPPLAGRKGAFMAALFCATLTAAVGYALARWGRVA